MTAARFRGPFGRALRDLGIVVAGVLVALSADAWWGGRVDRGRELEYLTTLQGDLALMMPELARAIEADSVTASTGRAALTILRAADPPAPGTPFSIALNIEDISIPTGTLRGLIGTGDIRLVRSADLRAAILSFDALLDRALVQRTGLETAMIEDVRGLVHAGEVGRLRSLGAPGPKLMGATMPELRRNAEFIGALASLELLLRNRVSIHQDLLAAAEQLDGAVSAEVGRRGR